MRRRLLLSASLCLALLLGACGGGGGGASGGVAVVPAPAPSVPAADGSYSDANQYSNRSSGALSAPNENAATLHSSMRLGSQTLAYTASSGHLTATDARSGKAASMFYVAYTLDGADAATRPITFLYNGGPGSSSLWLHMGSFGPKRIVTNVPSTILPTPVQLVDNQETLLDTSDLVFIDAVGTGFSQAIAPRANLDFWSVDSDAAVFRDFIQRYLAVNKRSASPKFLFGESYGGPRTAVLANLLEQAGVRLAGAIVLSPVLNYNSNCGVFNPGTVSCEGYVPSYAAIGAYHLRSNPLPTDLSSYLRDARAFAAGAYRSAIGPFIASRVAPPASVAAQMAAYTGLSAASWQLDLDNGPTPFQKTVLPGQLVGRYDARMAAPNGSALTVDNDPSLTVVNGAFNTSMQSYLLNTLKYSAASNYTTFVDIIDGWDFRHDGNGLPDTVPDLAAAMLQNPQLKFLSMHGYYDLATPFYQTELDLARLGANPNITIKNYASGHMAYLDDTARRAQRADLQAFYQSATGGK